MKRTKFEGKISRMTSDPKTVIEEYESTHEGAMEMAAARLTSTVRRLLAAGKRASGLAGKRLASDLGVSEGRISQVLNGDGNIKVAALAKYLRAMGYTATIVVTPAVDGRPPINLGGRSRSTSPDSPPTNWPQNFVAGEFGWVDAAIRAHAATPVDVLAQLWVPAIAAADNSQREFALGG